MTFNLLFPRQEETIFYVLGEFPYNDEEADLDHAHSHNAIVDDFSDYDLNQARWRSHRLVEELWVEIALVIAVVLVRFLLRFTSKNKSGPRRKLWRWDDCFMAFALLAYASMAGLLLVLLKEPTALIRHMDEHAHPSDKGPSLEDRAYFNKLFFVAEVMNMVCTWGCKLSLLGLIYYIGKGSSGFTKWVSPWVYVYVTFGWCIDMFLFLVFWCRPIDNYWKAGDKPEQCRTWEHHFITHMLYNATCDLGILALPIPMIWELKMSLWNRIFLILPFFHVLFTVICGVFSKYLMLNEPKSLIWVGWYIRECCAAMIIANTPNLFPKVCQWVYTARHLHASAHQSRHKSQYAPIERTRRSLYDLELGDDSTMPTPTASIAGDSGKNSFGKDELSISSGLVDESLPIGHSAYAICTEHASRPSAHSFKITPCPYEIASDDAKILKNLMSPKAAHTRGDRFADCTLTEAKERSAWEAEAYHAATR